MLSEKSTATVRATLPAVGAAIGTITERFYERLFAAHPELLRDLFNRGNQAAGLQKQALAGSIAAFATHLVDQPEDRPDVMLNRIANKHASLGVTADQYKIVHRHLFAAIAEVLGGWGLPCSNEAESLGKVAPEVAEAWDEVYWLMANALIAIEARLYEERGVLAGDVWREWTVAGRIEETADCATFRLRPADGAPAPAFRAGQYVSVQVELADGARQIRQYSLSSAPGSGLRSITVKRVQGDPDGEVSGHLYAHVREGDRLRVSAPYGDLVLDAGLDTDDAPLLLASAGIGCTPMLSILEQLAAAGHRAPVTVVHADRSLAEHPLRDEHAALTAKLPDAAAHFWYESPEPGHPADRTGLVDLTTLPVPSGTRAYLCGPLPFMRAVRTQLLAKGVAAADIHYEVFGPDLWLAQG
jgi:nitric oxide dioxygenase